MIETVDEKELVSEVWNRRRELSNWSYHVSEIRNDDSGPAFAHETAERAFMLARSLVRFVAVPWGIDLSPRDVLTLAEMILDHEVPA